MSRHKVLTAVLGTIAFGVVAFGGAVTARLTDSHDVICWNPERRAWDHGFVDVTARDDGDWLVLRRGFPPHVVARFHKSIACMAVLSGNGQ